MADYYVYPSDKVRVWCMNCSKWGPLEVPDRCPACTVKREGVRDQAEPQAVTQLEDPAEPGWQAKHSKPAWVVKEVKDG